MGLLQTSSYGSWKSPISAESGRQAAKIGLEQIKFDGNDVYWIERRAQEGGRKVIVRRSSDGTSADVTPAEFNARTRVHEYGGGDYAVSDGTLIFSNFTDQRLYRQERGSEPKPLTPNSARRYADGQVDRRRNHFLCVREDHSTAGEAVNTLVRIDLAGGDEGTIVVSGNDFYSSPRLSPDGSQLAWLTWNHPNMPWDGTELWVAQLNETGTVIKKEKIAGGVDESIFQPEWSPDGTLYFVSDRTGWWNLYRWKENKVEPLCPDGSGIWPASVGFRRQPLWLCLRATNRMLLHKRAVVTISPRWTPKQERWTRSTFPSLRSLKFVPVAAACYSSARLRLIRLRLFHWT